MGIYGYNNPWNPLKAVYTQGEFRWELQGTSTVALFGHYTIIKHLKTLEIQLKIDIQVFSRSPLHISSPSSAQFWPGFGPVQPWKGAVLASSPQLLSVLKKFRGGSKIFQSCGELSLTADSVCYGHCRNENETIAGHEWNFILFQFQT